MIKTTIDFYHFVSKFTKYLYNVDNFYSNFKMKYIYQKLWFFFDFITPPKYLWGFIFDDFLYYHHFWINKTYMIIEYEKKIRLLLRSNSVKLGTYCNPSDNDCQPWSSISFPQKKK